jgi:hypothetical protein
MNYLQMCQAVIEEIGLSGQISSVQSQTGDFARIVRHVRNACSQIEGRWINWRFLHGIHTFTTTQGIATYPAPEALRLRRWDHNRVFINKMPIDGYEADDSIRYTKNPNEEGFNGMPTKVIIERNNDLRFIGIPDSEYNIEIEYFRMATVLTNDTDVPAIPEQFRDIVVQDAIRRYANYDEAPELKRQALEQIYGINGNWNRPEPGSWLYQLQADQLPYSLTHGATDGGFFVVEGS